jgi:hypothetical protein
MKGNPMQALCGEPCKNHKMENGRCRMHGGKSTGRPATHGNFSKEALKERSRVVKLNREIRSLMREI